MGLFARFRRRSSDNECGDVTDSEFKVSAGDNLEGQKSVGSQNVEEVQESVGSQNVEEGQQSVEIPRETKRDANGRIVFRYHPNLYEDDILIKGEGVCQCCGKTVHEYIENVYSPEDIDCICLECVYSGEAAKKFKATFVEDAEHVSNPAKRNELFCCTPGYSAWQGEYWLACCDDYCQYLRRVGMKELEEMGIKEKVLEEYASHDDGYPLEVLEDCLYKDGDMSGYLFKCSHCGKYRLYVDAS